MINPSPEDVHNYIIQNLPCEMLHVEGDGRHFIATIITAAFSGKSRVTRHQLVYQALSGRMREEIHALSIKAYTPEEWRATQSR